MTPFIRYAGAADRRAFTNSSGQFAATGALTSTLYERASEPGGNTERRGTFDIISVTRWRNIGQTFY